MNAVESTSQHGTPSATETPPFKHVLVTVGLTVFIGLALIVFVRPHVYRWLEVQRAYWNLSSTDEDARNEAVRLLRSGGLATEDALITLLHHRDSAIRDFAAAELAHRSPLTDDIIEAFLTALESNQHVAEIGRQAPMLFFRYGEDATGPLTKTDHRILTWLKAELKSPRPDKSGQAAWALTAFVNRAPSLQSPLTAYVKNGAFFYRYVVLREMADRDPSMHDKYVALLLEGLGSNVYTDQQNALHGLVNLKSAPDDLRSQLEARRTASSDPEEVSRIDQVLAGLDDIAADQP